MEQMLAGLELWMLPNTWRLRNSKVKADFSVEEALQEELFDIYTLLATAGAGVVSQGVRASLESLGLLSPEGEVGFSKVTDIPLVTLRSSTRYWDYSQPGVMRRDAEDMVAYQRESPSIDLFSDGCEAATWMRNRHSACLLALAHFVLDAQNRENFHHEIVDKKIVPSLGARHGINGYIWSRSRSRERDSWVSIRPDGSNVAVSALPEFPESECRSAESLEANVESDATECLILCANYERYQWRYRNGWIYQCIYLDLGHVLAALKLRAQQIGMQLTVEHAQHDLMGVDRELVNEPLVKIVMRHLAAKFF